MEVSVHTVAKDELVERTYDPGAKKEKTVLDSQSLGNGDKILVGHHYTHIDAEDKQASTCNFMEFSRGLPLP